MNAWQQNVTLLPCTGLKPVVPLGDDTSCWPKSTQRDQSQVTCPSISTRMRKRRAFADKELENVMLERELRHRELHNDLSYSALVPVLHPPPLPVSPRLHCYFLNKDPTTAGASSYVSVYKYKPAYECDFQFYQFVHLKSSAEGNYSDLLCQSSGQTREDEEITNSWRVCERVEQLELIPSPSQQRHHGRTLTGLELVKSPSETREIMGSNGSSTNTCSISGSSQIIMGGLDVSAASRTFDPLTEKGWSTDTRTNPAGAHADSVKSPHGSSVRTPAVRPLPFSVEALLRAWQANGEQHSAHCSCAD